MPPNKTIKEYSKEAAEKLVKKLSKVNIKEAKGEGEFEVIATTGGVDRDGENILIDGWDFTNFMKNPVVLFGHDYWSFPIGAVTDLRIEGDSVIAKGVFARTEEGQKARVLYEDGILKTVSVGFMVKNRDGNTITSAELLELSFVPVPSNPDAIDARKRVKEFKAMMIKSAIPYLETALASEETEWSESDAMAAVKEWAMDSEELDFGKYSQCFAWVDSTDEESESSYKLLHHTVIEGEVTCIFNGVVSCMINLLGAESGVPEEDRQSVYDHLAAHYKDFGKDAPELKEYTQYELDNMIPGKKDDMPDDQKGQVHYIVKNLKQDLSSLIADAFEKIATVTGEVKSDVKPNLKAGRTLSAKTESSIINAVDAMGIAVKELKSLLESVKTDDAKTMDSELLKALQAIDKAVEGGIRNLKGRVKK